MDHSSFSRPLLVALSYLPSLLIDKRALPNANCAGNPSQPSPALLGGNPAPSEQRLRVARPVRGRKAFPGWGGTARARIHFFRRDSFRDQEALALNKSALSRSNFAIGRSRADSRDYAPEENLRSMGCVQYPGYKTLRTHAYRGVPGG